MSKMYLDNAKFLKSLDDYKDQVAKATANNEPLPQMPAFLGKCFYDICENMSRRPEFINYSFRDEMVSDAIENCMKYWYTFDSSKSKNPFGYFSRTIWRAFVRRILDERDQTYIKYKMTFNSGVLDLGQDLTDSNGNAIVEANSLAENMYTFVQEYEQKLADKKKLKKDKIKAAKKNDKPRKKK